MKVQSKVNTSALKNINKNAIDSLIKTAMALKTDLQQSQTMPFDKGDLQNKQTFVDDSESASGKVAVITEGPQARRLYFHPEYNFQKKNNPNAGGMWFEPYIDGNKKDFVPNTFKQFMRSKK
jgi:molybdenum cofactor biosynthesis enzyme MoaA